MRYLFAPGCALTIENPKSAERIFKILNHHVQEMERLDICCRNHPDLAPGTAFYGHAWTTGSSAS